MDEEKCAAAMVEIREIGKRMASEFDKSVDTDLLPEPCILCNAVSHGWSECPLAFQVPSAGSSAAGKDLVDLLAALKAVKFQQQAHNEIVVDRRVFRQIQVAY
jgi:hypothetical protein